MRNFIRSLKYLKPYRPRIALAVLCTVAISVLWAGGLAMVLPGAKILLAPEGLHGWAYRLAASDRLKTDLSTRLAPEGTQVSGQPMSWVLETSLAKSKDDSVLGPGQWLVGLDDGDPQHQVMRAEPLARLLANSPEGTEVRLRVYTLSSGELANPSIAAGKLHFVHAALLKAVSMFKPPQTYADRYRLLVALLVIAVILSILRNALRVVQEYLSTSSVLYAIRDIRNDNYKVALRMPVSHFAQRGTTDTVSRFMQDIGMLGRGLVTLLGRTLVEPFKAVAVLVTAMILSWKLTLITMIAGPFAFLAIRKLGKAMHKVSHQALMSMSQMLEVLEETLGGIRVVKAYTMENHERRRFLRINRQMLQQGLTAFLVDALSSPIVEAVGLVAAMGAVALAGYWVFHSQHDLDAEKFLTIMACLVAMFDPIRKLSSVSTVFHASEAAAARIMELHDSPQEQTVPGAQALRRHSRSIEFRNVGFSYDGPASFALRGINFAIRNGDKVAIVGPNGSGKTTMVSLIPRLLQATSGQILIDGHDIAAATLRSLRRQIGLVTQDAVLFHASIAENISYGLRRASMDRILDASRRAYADEFIRKLPAGYDTIVSPRGATLSGGEKQRIAIARAILRDPTILIFDEAMSQIDSYSEHLIQKAMDEFSRGRTTLIIAHRFATVRSADRIIVMNEGAVEDTGTHEELMQRCELYKRLYSTQLSDTAC